MLLLLLLFRHSGEFLLNLSNRLSSDLFNLDVEQIVHQICLLCHDLFFVHLVLVRLCASTAHRLLSLASWSLPFFHLLFSSGSGSRTLALTLSLLLYARSWLSGRLLGASLLLVPSLFDWGRRLGLLVLFLTHLAWWLFGLLLISGSSGCSSSLGLHLSLLRGSLLVRPVSFIVLQLLHSEAHDVLHLVHDFQVHIFVRFFSIDFMQYALLAHMFATLKLEELSLSSTVTLIAASLLLSLA